MLAPIQRRQKRTMSDFDLTIEACRRIVDAAHTTMLQVGSFAPANGRGFAFYIAFVDAFRASIVTRRAGWRKNAVEGVEVVEHSARKLRLGYLSSDYDPLDGELRAARSRGPTSIDIAANNAQLTLRFPLESIAPTAPKPVRPLADQGFETWFLTVCRVTVGYRLEIALPTVCAESGRFVGWEQRIPVGDFPVDDKPKASPEPAAAPKPRIRRKTPNGGGGPGQDNGSATGTA